MSRFTFLLVIFFALLAFTVAQSSSSTGIDDSSSSSSELSSSSSSSGISSSSSSSSESSSGISSSTGFSSSSELSSSSSEAISSSASNPLPFVPSNWGDLDILGNNTVLVVSWETKSADNLMHDFGTSMGFAINNISGATLRLARGNQYNITIDSTAAPFGFYLTYNATGDEAAGNITVPITTAGSTVLTVPYIGNDTDVFIYYASSNTPYAGGAIILSSQSAAALQASFMVLIISAFVSLVFPKW